MEFSIVEGDLLEQDVEAIVNAWNRNLIPWWLLLPQGVSGAIKWRAGTEPFRQLRRHGVLPLGAAVATGAGRLPHRAIIHVAGINHLWRASERSVRDSVRNACALAEREGYRSLAFPIIGAGSGQLSPASARAAIESELRGLDSTLRVVVVVKAGAGGARAPSPRD